MATLEIPLTDKTLDRLTEENVMALQQGLDLLAGVDDQTYARRSPSLPPHRAGAHLRHILEFYECFLEGAPRRVIDYDGRRRDLRTETDRTYAVRRIHDLIEGLRGACLEGDELIEVRVEDAPGDESGWLKSTPGRELQFLRSHTIHHYALIAVTLQSLNHPVPADFGMAPSTLRHLARRRQCAR